MLRHLPNAICVLRIALTWPAVTAIDRGDYGTALLVFAIAALSDGIDGYLAKRFNWISDLGRALDPLADKILLVAVFLSLTWQGLVARDSGDRPRRADFRGRHHVSRVVR
jgi:cardiolipin synthase